MGQAQIHSGWPWPLKYTIEKSLDPQKFTLVGSSRCSSSTHGECISILKKKEKKPNIDIGFFFSLITEGDLALWTRPIPMDTGEQRKSFVPQCDTAVLNPQPLEANRGPKLIELPLEITLISIGWGRSLTTSYILTISHPSASYSYLGLVMDPDSPLTNKT